MSFQEGRGLLKAVWRRDESRRARGRGGQQTSQGYLISWFVVKPSLSSSPLLMQSKFLIPLSLEEVNQWPRLTLNQLESPRPPVPVHFRSSSLTSGRTVSTSYFGISQALNYDRFPDTRLLSYVSYINNISPAYLIKELNYPKVRCYIKSTMTVWCQWTVYM